MGVEPEELFDQLVQKAPPGSQGLVLQPYWSPGLKVPPGSARRRDRIRRCAHSRAFTAPSWKDLGYGLREGAERIARRSGVPVTEIRVAGGGSQSRCAMQITADIFGLPFHARTFTRPPGWAPLSMRRLA